MSGNCLLVINKSHLEEACPTLDLYEKNLENAMDYQKHYDALIQKAQQRLIEGYHENHHILPKSLGGTDIPANIVKLTPEEHYLAHQLLVKIYEKSGDEGAYAKMLHALNLMSGKSNLQRKNKYYGWIRRKVSEYRRGRKHTEESKLQNSQTLKNRYAVMPHHLKGKTLSAEHKEKVKQALKNRKFSEEHKLKISQSLMGKKKNRTVDTSGKNNPSYKPYSQETAAGVIHDIMAGIDRRIIASKYGIGGDKINEILRDNQIDTTLRKCPHCQKIGQSRNMMRWHFDRCRSKE